MATAHEPEVKKLDDSFQFYGICVNCLHDLECAHRQNPDKPILFCEQYDVLARHVAKLEVKTKKPESQEYVNNFQGLCKNCDSRANCRFPAQEGGIWHCEEYQ